MVYPTFEEPHTQLFYHSLLYSSVPFGENHFNLQIYFSVWFISFCPGATLGKLKRCHSLKLLRSRDKEKLSRSNSFKSTGTSPGPHADIENIEAVKSKSVADGIFPICNLIILVSLI